MSQATLRDATRADLPAIAEIYAHAVKNGTASYELEPPTLAEMGERLAALEKGGYPYIVAADAGGSLLGYAYAGPFRPRPAYRFIVENSIYIAPALQGRGIGRLLLSGLIERCAALGFRQMIAVIGDSANTASIRIHAHAGFALIGTHPNVGLKFGRWLDTVMMQRALGAGSASVPGAATPP